MDVIVHGAAGRMGQLVCAELARRGHTAIGVDRTGAPYATLDGYTGPADLVIDFSSHVCADEVAGYCLRRGLPLVEATTGYTPAELHSIEAAAEQIPVFQSYNMSLGVAILAKLAGLVSETFGPCDVEIVETHHNRKADAPSGTALLLADAVAAHRPEVSYVFGRSGHQPRQSGEIGIHALRMGNVVGDHEIFFATDTQTITLRHQAHDRALFAEGAVRAAEFLQGRAPGLYHMDDLLGR